PALSLVLLPVLFVHEHIFALDVHNWYWPAGHRVLDGQSPYAQPYPWGLNYPALAAMTFAPLALLPRRVADVGATVLVVCAVPAALKLLDVADRRIYAIAMLWPPVVYGWQTANLSLLLVVGIAAAWRLRDRAVIAGVIVAVVVSLKPVLWPLGLWLLTSRRYRALACAMLSALALSVGAFATLGLGEVGQYVAQLHRFLPDAERRSYSIFSLALHLGANHALAYAVLAAATVVAVSACVDAGRKGHETAAISAAIAASLLASPVVEAHYLAIVLVPLALSRPRITALWLLPLALWVTPANWPTDWQRIVFLGVGTAILVAPTARLTTAGRKPRLIGPSAATCRNTVGQPT
ncbi:MAG: glycosyltransferase family 87 protein, partial [Solirubrobacteraceae bacterium]